MDKLNIEAFVDKIDGKMTAIASDETLDRQGDVLSIDAWDLKNYKKNPVLQFAHDYYSPPVGIAKNIRIEDKKLLFEPVFHEFTEVARSIKKLYEEGIMKAFSVGFISHTKDSGKESKIRLELLEISAVPVPANPHAVVVERAAKSKINDYTIKQIDEWIADNSKTKVWEEKENEIRYRVKNPDLFQDDSFIRFPKDDGWSLDKAKKWVEEHPEIKKEFNEIEEKSGRVLSKKTMTIIEKAIEVLKELLENASGNNESENDDKNKSKKKYIKIKKAIKQKGRDPEDILIAKTLEAISKQLGYLIRKNIKK